MTRAEINKKMADNDRKIAKLNDDNRILWEQGMLLCDDKQWYTESVEKVENRVGKGQPKVKKDVLIGRIHWKEDFQDASKPDEPVTVERSQIVRIDGVWQ